MITVKIIKHDDGFKAVIEHAFGTTESLIVQTKEQVLDMISTFMINM